MWAEKGMSVVPESESESRSSSEASVRGGRARSKMYMRSSVGRDWIGEDWLEGRRRFLDYWLETTGSKLTWNSCAHSRYAYPASRR